MGLKEKERAELYDLANFADIEERMAEEKKEMEKANSVL